MTRGNQFLFCRRIDAVETGRNDRWRADPHMHFFGAGLADHFHDLAAGGSADDRIIDDDDTFAMEHLGDGIQLDLHAEVPDRLFGLDEGTSHVMVPDQTSFEWNTGSFAIA